MPTDGEPPRAFRSFARLMRWLTLTWAAVGLVSLSIAAQLVRLHLLLGVLADGRPLGSSALARLLIPRELVGVETGGFGLDALLGALWRPVFLGEIALAVFALPAGILFYVFLFRVRRNLAALGQARPKYAAHWILTGWLVPLFNLVRPYQVVADLWRASAAGSSGQVPRRLSSPLPRLWWEGVLVTSGLGLWAGWVVGRHEVDWSGWLAVFCLAEIGLVVLFLLLARSLSEMQTARAEGREPRAASLSSLPMHAGVDVAAVALLAVALWGGYAYGSSRVARAFASMQASMAAQRAAQAPREASKEESGGIVPPVEVGGIEGAPGGVPGGAPGGVVGGIEGVSGGVPGGAPGGVVGGIEGGTAGNATAAQPGALLRAGSDVPAAVKISGDPPIYPPIARKARVQGMVILQATIDAKGSVGEVKVLKGMPLGLDEAAIRAVKRWKFRPVRLNGRPVSVSQTLTVVFQLE